MRILIVEDEKDHALQVKTILEDEKYIVSTVFDGNSALEMQMKIK